MHIHHLLLRGMLVGIVAGLLAFGFAKVFGEPSVDRAIAFESAEVAAHSHDAHAHGGAPEQAEPELVSRTVQASIGLLTGVVVYGGALGGLFAIAFAICYGRFTRLSIKTSSAIIGLLGFIAVYAVPFLKYPANPPSVGEPETIGMRTGLYFSMIAISIIAMVVAFSLKRLSERRLGSWNATVAAGAVFVVLIAIAQVALPSINEVPTEFPATTLWQFRIASFGIQAVLWTVIALLFGELTERGLSRPAVLRTA
jgi:predicted cobalt transporter CbtA